MVISNVSFFTIVFQDFTSNSLNRKRVYQYILVVILTDLIIIKDIKIVLST